MADIWHPVDDMLRVTFEEAVGEISECGYHPIRCPNCYQANLRIYFRHYPPRGEPEGTKERRGTCWTWCPHCHLFLYFTGYLPDWWPRQDPIPEITGLSPNGIDVDDYWEVILKALAPRPSRSE